MTKIRLVLVLALSSVAAVAAAAVAYAGPGGPNGANFQAHFFDCTGPAGTPSSFDAERQEIGTAWLLTDGTRIFDVAIEFDETTNTQVFVTPGFVRNAVPLVTCRFVGPISGHTFRASGILTRVR